MPPVGKVEAWPCAALALACCPGSDRAACASPGWC